VKEALSAVEEEIAMPSRRGHQEYIGGVLCAWIGDDIGQRKRVPGGCLCVFFVDFIFMPLTLIRFIDEF
jgi:hypothetical protein